MKTAPKSHEYEKKARERLEQMLTSLTSKVVTLLRKKNKVAQQGDEAEMNETKTEHQNEKCSAKDCAKPD